MAVSRTAPTTTSPEQELLNVEHAWSQAVVNRDGPALQRFYADEYLFTDADGIVTNKLQEMKNITSVIASVPERILNGVSHPAARTVVFHLDARRAVSLDGVAGWSRWPLARFDDFRGRLSLAQTEAPSAFERAQYKRALSGWISWLSY